MSYTKEQRADNKLLEAMREQYPKAVDACSTLYEQARRCIKFVAQPGNQWDDALKQRRRNRPTYEFPKLRMQLQQIINEMRQTRPQGKVRGVEEADTGLAELMQGLCRNIESTSNAERAYDIAFESAVLGGMGVWRVCTDYQNDDDLEQDIRIKPIRNFACVKFDPAAVEIDRRDARYVFVEELIPKSQFEADYPDAKLSDFEGDANCRQHWQDRDQVRIAEYWYKKSVTREVWALSNGAVVNSDDEGMSEDAIAALGLQIVKRRTVKGHTVCMRMTNGHEWLTDEYEFPSKFIPIVVTWGNITNIDGEDYWCGATIFGMDQQRLHNVHRTALIEAVAKSPKAPFILNPKWIEGYDKFWNNANAEDYPYLPAKIDQPGLIQRSQQAEVPVALIQLAGMDADDMKAATGIYDASLGARSNETSGLAINSRKQQGATATFNYIDNLTYAIRYTYEILVDMIPRVYDTPRVVRILGEDGSAKWQQLYQEVVDPDTGQRHVLNDISKGKYDVTVTVGPAYATQRMEAAEGFAQLAGQIGGAFPAVGPLLAYATLHNSDLPGMDKIDKALHRVLVQQGLMEPDDGEDPPQPPQPNPKDVADAQQKQSSAALNQAKAEGQQLDNAAKGMQMQAAHAALHGLAPPMGPQFGPPDPGYGFQPPQGGFFSPDGSPPGSTGF